MSAYNWVYAVKLEFEARSATISDTRVGGVLNRARDSFVDALRRGLGRLGNTGAGSATGRGARRLAIVLSRLPVLTMSVDAVRAFNCVDLLKQEVRENPRDPLRLVQLAEALDATRRDLATLNVVRLALSPVSLATSTALRTTAAIGRSPALSDVERLVRRTHRAAIAQEMETFDGYLALSRAYRLVGKPGLAIEYAVLAIELARYERAVSPTNVDAVARFSRAWRKTRVPGVLREVRDGASRGRAKLANAFRGDIAGLPPHERTLKQEGAALTALGWAYRDLRNAKGARHAAQRAINAGFSCGYEVLAALDVGPGEVDQAIPRRHDILQNVTRGDRAYYRGHWRGGLRISGAAAAEQVSKTKRLLDGV